MLSVKFPVKGVMGRVMPSLEQLSDEDGGCRMRLSGWGAVCVCVAGHTGDSSRRSYSNLRRTGSSVNLVWFADF